MEWLKKITDFIMPVEAEEEEYESEQVVVKKEEPVAAVKERQVVNGGTVTDTGSVKYGGMSYTASHVAAAATSVPHVSATTTQQTANAKPQFTVHSNKAAQSGNMMIRLCTPRNFDQVTTVADDIKGKRAVLINYDKVDLEEQRRICDFVNGVCYVTNGDARRISNNIVLYVPDGVDAEEAVTIALAH